MAQRRSGPSGGRSSASAALSLRRSGWCSARRCSTASSTTTTTSTSTTTAVVRRGLTLRRHRVGLHARRTPPTGIRSPGCRTCWTASSSGSSPAGHHLTSLLLHARRRGPAVPGPAADDRGALAQRLRGDLFAVHPAARRVGGVGVGTQGRPQRTVLHADAGGVRPLCPTPRLAGAISLVLQRWRWA